MDMPFMFDSVARIFKCFGTVSTWIRPFISVSQNVLLKIFKRTTSFATKTASRLILSVKPNLNIIMMFIQTQDLLMNICHRMQLAFMSQP